MSKLAQFQRHKTVFFTNMVVPKELLVGNLVYVFNKCSEDVEEEVTGS